MAHKTKDGKKSYTNKPQADAYDRRSSNPSASPASVMGSNDMHDDDPNNDGATENTQDQMDSPDGAAMMEQHGPAHKLVIQHDEGSGMHTVHAAHADGHEHMTQHGSVGEAHQYAADCAGAGSGGM